MTAIHVLVPSFNCRQWIERCLGSVADQDVRPAGVLVIDDASDEPGFMRLASEVCRSYGYSFLRNATNRKCPYNLWRGVPLLDAGPEDVIFLLDGDDFLPDPTVFRQIAEVYADPAVWLCADTETEILTRRGWLRYDAVHPGDVALTLNTQLALAEWQPVTDVYISPDVGCDVIATRTRSHSSVTTPDHRWPILPKGGGALRWRTTSTFVSGDSLLAAAPVVNLPDSPKWSDALVELVAWFYTEGWLGKGSRRENSVTIAQSHAVNPANVARIRACLTSVYGSQATAKNVRHTAAWVEDTAARMTHFRLNKPAGKVLTELAPGKVPSIAFLTELTHAQLELFIATSIDADGTRKSQGSVAVFAQKVLARSEAFQTACLLAGRSGSVRQQRDGRFAFVLRFGERRTVGGGRARQHSGLSVGPVWCPSTPNATWCARRDGTIYFTGNTYGNYAPYPHDTGQTPATAYPPDVVARRAFRSAGSLFNHPLTFRQHLWDALSPADLQTNDGRWYRGGYDRAIMIPMLEMSAPDHFRFLDRTLYSYNAVNPISDSLVNANLIDETADMWSRPVKEPHQC